MAGAATAAKRKATQARAAAPALLQKIDVISNENKTSSVSLVSGTVRVLYWESILSIFSLFFSCSRTLVTFFLISLKSSRLTLCLLG